MSLSLWSPVFLSMSTDHSETGIVCLLAKSCLTLCNPLGCSPQDSSVHGIFQARILEYPFPSPGVLPYPEIEPGSPTLRADSLPSEQPGNRSPQNV